MTEKKSKPVSELRIADLLKNPVWQIMNDDRNAELDVQAVKRLPSPTTTRITSTTLRECYNTYNTYVVAGEAARSVVISMRLPKEIGNRLKRMANRHGWTPSDASARLVEEGLRRSEFAFIDFRDSAADRQAYIQGSSLAVWEVMLVVPEL